MRRGRNAKIVATLGPASASSEMIADLYRAGADAFRLNFSHGTHDDHRATYGHIRALEKDTGAPIAVLADLQGPKLRVGKFKGGAVTLARGQKFRLDLDRAQGDKTRAPLPHKEVFQALEPGMRVLLDDGRIRLKIIKSGADFAETEVVTGGRLSDHKGVNVPDAVLPLKALTAKDRRDLAFAVDLGADWLALSFVQRPDDIAEARKLSGGHVAIMAKIEKPAAVERFDEILELADGVMVARGDLGIEMLPEQVPGVQKQIVRAARQAGKPVVVATQMLESMIGAPEPTRAEASDVATAVYDGGDAVMLSAESAVGDYPREAVAMMDRIIREVERDPLHRQFLDANYTAPEATAPDAISAAASQVARTVDAAAIVTYSKSGATALRAARERPDVPVVALIPNLAVARRLSLVWGLHCVRGEDARDFDEMVAHATRAVFFGGFGTAGQRVVITAGVPFGTPGATNLLHIAWLGDLQDHRKTPRDTTPPHAKSPD